MYKISNFHNKDSLGVICRGSSVSVLYKYVSEFECCFLVGQFDNSLKKNGKIIINKKKVLILNKCAIQPDKSICKKNNIKDLQANFGKLIDEPLSLEKTSLYKRIKKKNRWAKVYLAPLGLLERRPVDYPKWCTTGLFALDLACFYQPKKVFIIGLDFYHSNYYCEERIKAGIKRNKKRAGEMLENFYAILKRDSNIEFHIYTKCRIIEPRNNLFIHVV